MEEIFKISKDERRAKALKDLARKLNFYLKL
jgi:hypothetical protein